MFVFGPRRVAVLLIGGDKAGEWKAWYDQIIAEAVRLYNEYLQDLRDEGLLPSPITPTRAPRVYNHQLAPKHRGHRPNDERTYQVGRCQGPTRSWA